MKNFGKKFLCVLLTALMAFSTVNVTFTHAEDLGRIDITDESGTTSRTIEMTVGDTVTIIGRSGNDVWNTVSPSGIITLTKSGSDRIVTAVAPGTATFTRDFYKVGSTYYRHSNFTIVVKPRLTASLESINLYEGQRDAVFEAATYDAGTSTVTSALTTYSVVSGSDVISAAGNSNTLTALKVGTAKLRATVTATVNGGTYTATADADVNVFPNLNTISFNSDNVVGSAIVLYIGESATATASYTLHDPAGRTNYTPSFSASNNLTYTANGNQITITAGNVPSEGEYIRVTYNDAIMPNGAKVSEQIPVIVKDVDFIVTPTAYPRSGGNIVVGDTQTYPVSISSDHANMNQCSDIVWHSSNENVVTVDANGNISIVGKGTANVYATLTYRGRNYTTNNCAVTVNTNTSAVEFTATTKALEVGVPHVTEEATIPEGVSYEFRAIVIKIEAGLASGDIVYTTSDGSIVSVDNLGDGKATVTGLTRGTADVVAAADDAVATAHITVVSNIETVNLPPAVTMYKNSTKDLKANMVTYVNESGRKLMAEPGDGGYEVSYRSGDPSIAMVSDGVVTAMKAGTCTVMVTIDGVDYFVEVTVKDGIKEIGFDPNEETLEVGDTMDLTDDAYVVYMLDGDETTEGLAAYLEDHATTITWTSLNEDIASVDENGVVTALAKGYATISLEAEGLYANLILKVTEDGEEPEFDNLRYTITINYIFAEGEKAGQQAADPYVGSFIAGSPISLNVTSPTNVLGYVAETEVYQEEIPALTAGITRTVLYYPAEVTFKVRYYKETAERDVYELAEEASFNGRTEDIVGSFTSQFDTKSYENYYKLSYNRSATIAADGSTVVEIYYNRKSFLVKFEQNGGTGADPVYLPFGASYTVNDPVRDGYTFAGWYKDAAFTQSAAAELANPVVPTQNVTYYAKWNPLTANYMVFHWHQNADDDEYSFKEAETKSGTSGTATNATAKNYANFSAKTIQQEIINGDGSTIVNVYYDRAIFTVKFYNNNRGDRELTEYRITGRYGQDIHNQWPGGIWYVNKNSTSTVQSNIGILDKNYSFYGQKTGSTVETKYYVEMLEGDTSTNTFTYQGTTYVLDHTDHNPDGWRVTNDDKYNMTGFTYKATVDNNGQSTTSLKCNMLYSRNKHNITYYSKGSIIHTENNIPYGKSLSDKSFNPTMQPGYSFGGWYKDELCQEPFNFDSTMPDMDIVLYAKWTPLNVTLTVISENIINETNSVSFTQPRGFKVTENPAWSAVEDGDNREFLGWFKDVPGDNPVPFTFETNIFVNTVVRARFRNDNEVTVYINYLSQEDDSILHAQLEEIHFEGDFKTYDAEVIPSTGTPWFPVTNSHTITMAPNAGNEDYDEENDCYVYTFYYVQKESVNYTINYINQETNELLDSEEKTTRNNVVTESAKAIDGYRAMDRQKTLVLSATESENVINFYYKPSDGTTATVEIYYYLEDPDNLGAYLTTPYATFSDDDATVGETYDYEVITITGYDYDHVTFDPDNNGVVSANGLTISVFYNCLDYGYSFKFMKAGTTTELHTPITGEAAYKSTVTQNALDIPGYVLNSASSQSIKIGKNASDNVKIFYYSEATVNIQYVSVNPECTVSRANERILAINGTPAGSTAADPTGLFDFVGWFDDEACEDENLVSTDLVFVPSKNDDNVYESKTYYAKWEQARYNYTVKCYLNGTEVILNQDGGTKDIDYTAQITPPTITGYTAVSATAKTLSKDNANLVFYYYKNVTLTANSKTETYDKTEKSVSGFIVAGELTDYAADFSAITVGATGTNAGTYPAAFATGTVGTVDATAKYIVTAATDGQLVINPIESITITITGNTDTKVYNKAEQSVTGFTTNSTDSTISIALAEGSEAKAAGTNVGTYWMELEEADFVATSPNYTTINLVVNDGKLVITPINDETEITVTGNHATYVYDGDEHSVSGWTSNASDIDSTISVEMVSGSASATGTNVNNYKMNLTAEQFEATSPNYTNLTIKVVDGYLDITPVKTTITVTITGTTETKTYNKTEQQTSGYTTDVTDDTIIVALKEGRENAIVAKGTNAGTYNMTMSEDDFTVTSANYENIRVIVVPGKLVINKAQITINVTAEKLTKEYNGSEFVAKNVSFSCTDTTVYDATKISYTEKSAKSTDPCTEKAIGYKATDFSYTDPSVEATFVVTDGWLTVTNNDDAIVINVTGFEKTYDGNEYSATYSATGLPEGFELTAVLTNGALTDVDTKTASIASYTITKGGVDVTSMFTNVDATATATVKINPVVITVKANDKSKTYDGEALTDAGWEITHGALVGEDTIEVTVTGSQTEAGSSANVASNATVTHGKQQNYKFLYEDGLLTVTAADKLTIYVTGNTNTVDYNGSEQSITGYTTDAPAGITVNFTGTAVAKGTDANKYWMNLDEDMFSATSNNYTTIEFEVTDGWLLIKPVEDEIIVTITGNHDELTYDGISHEVNGFTYTISEEGTDIQVVLKSGKVAHAEGTNADTYKMNLTEDFFYVTSDNFTNITVEVVDGYLTINPIAEKTIAITGHTHTVTYDGDPHTVSGYNTSNTDETIEISFTGTDSVTKTDAGCYMMGLKAADFTGTSQNYTTIKFTVQDGWLNIDPSEEEITITITGDVKAYDYDAAEHKAEGYDINFSKEGTDIQVSLKSGVSALVKGTAVNVYPMGLSEESFDITTNNYLPEKITLVVTDGKLTINDNTHTITYKVDGSEVHVDSYLYKASVIPYAEPTKEGYTFSGWKTSDGQDIPATMPDKDIVVLGTFIADTDTEYTVQHWIEKLDGTFELKESETKYGTTNTTALANAKTYAGFTYDATVEGTKASGTITGDGSLVLKLYYTRDSYTVTYKVDGAQYGDAETYLFDADVTIKDEPTKTGYHFTGWKIGEADAENFKMPANNVVITGAFEANTDTKYVVNYYLQDLEQTGYILKESVEKAGTTGASVSAQIKAFDGFTLNSEAEGTKLSGIIAADGSLELNVYYDRLSHKLTYYVDNQKDGDSIDMLFDATITLKDEPTKAGYTFSGWALQNGEDVPAKMPNADVDVYGSFTANTDTKYMVEYYLQNVAKNGFDLKESEEKAGTTGATATAPEKTYTGFTLDKSIAGTKASGTITGDGLLVLKLYYTRDDYTVSYKVDGDAYGDAETYAFGATVTVKAEPTKAGYTFSGWSSTQVAELGTSFEMPATNVEIIGTFTANTDTEYKVEHWIEKLDGSFELKETENKAGTTDTTATATAKSYEHYTVDYTVNGTVKEGNIAADGSLVLKLYYKLNVHTVTYKVDGVEIDTPVSYKYGAPVVLREKYTMTGYTVSDWDVTEDFTMPDEDVIISASTRINSYTVTYKVDGVQIGNPETYDYAAPVTVRAKYEKEGYTVTDWSRTDFIMPAENVIITATMTANDYMITYFVDEAQYTQYTGKHVDDAITVDAEPTKAGYTFSGWTSEQIAELGTSFTMPAKDVEIRGSFTANNDTAYKVQHWTEKLDGTFELKETEDKTGTTDEWVDATAKTYAGFTFNNAIEGTILRGQVAGDGSLVLKLYYTRDSFTVDYKVDGAAYGTTETYAFEETVTVKAEPTKAGYTFSGWSSTQVETLGENFAMPAKNVVITGTFAANNNTKYTVEYYLQNEAKDGFTLKESEEKAGTTDATATAFEKTYTGFTLDKSIAGTKASGTITGDGSLVLKLYYTRDSYTVDYKVDGVAYGTTETYAFDNTVTVKAEPTKAGYTFSGWSSTQVAELGASFKMPATNVVIAGTFTANNNTTYMVEHWIEKLDGSYELKESEEKAGTTDTTATATANSYAGFTFDDSVEGTKISGNIAADGSLVLKLYYTRDTYTVVYKVNEVQVGETEYYKYEETVFVREKYEKTGYTASDWSKEGSFVMPAGDVIILATLSQNDYTVTYKVDNVQVGEAETYHYGDLVALRAKFEKTGYTVTDWDRSEDFFMPDEDVVINATSSQNTYTVIYMVDSVQVGDTEYYHYGDPVEVRVKYEKEGFEVTDWDINEDFSMPDEDVTIHATSRVKSYTLTYYVDGVKVSEESVVYAERITPRTEPTQTGYTFSGWSAIPEYMPAKDVDVYGSFKINEHDIIYIVDGEEYTTQHYRYDEEITTPTDDPEKEGYTFNGWETEEGEELPERMPDNDIIAVAKFTINKYLITYYVDEEYYYSEEITFEDPVTPYPEPTKVGHTFSGWSLIPDFMPANHVSVYGSFKINEHDIIYVVDGEEYTTQHYEYDEEIVPLADNPSKEGYDFLGWETEEGGDLPDRMPDEDITVTAKFQVKQFMVIYYVDGRRYDSQVYDFGAPITALANPTRTGYTFSGWSTIPGTMPAHDVEVFGTFRGRDIPVVRSYNVTYYLDGEVYLIQTYEVGTAIAPIADIEMEGYEFSGWALANGDAIPTTMPGENVDIYGSLTKIEESEPESESSEPESEESIDPTPTPLPRRTAWALINLICAALTTIISLLLIIFMKKEKKDEDDEDEDEKAEELKKAKKSEDEDDEDEDEDESKNHKGWRIFSIIVAIASIIFFILTEDMTKPMVLTDKYTIWMALILIGQFIVALFSNKRKDDNDEEEDDEKKANA